LFRHDGGRKNVAHLSLKAAAIARSSNANGAMDLFRQVTDGDRRDISNSRNALITCILKNCKQGIQRENLMRSLPLRPWPTAGRTRVGRIAGHFSDSIKAS
jgi:hypothetical protein